MEMDLKNANHIEIEMVKFLGHIKNHSPKYFNNQNNELIVVPSWNIYIGLNSVKTPLDLKCKVVEWLSRPACKGVSNYWQKRVRAIFNDYLLTDFNHDEMERIYMYLGNAIKPELTIKFIESGFDLEVLPEVPVYN